MLDLAPGWQMAVDRGPDWLFIRLEEAETAADSADLAERLWQTIQQHFTYRVVLELDQVGLLHSQLVGQLVLLHKRLHSHDGVLRLCGLSDSNQEVLRTSRLDDRFPQYRNRGEAVNGYRPSKPR
jgi:anti-anti-sigma regulatory factor